MDGWSSDDGAQQHQVPVVPQAAPVQPLHRTLLPSKPVKQDIEVLPSSLRVRPAAVGRSGWDSEDESLEEEHPTPSVMELDQAPTAEPSGSNIAAAPVAHVYTPVHGLALRMNIMIVLDTNILLSHLTWVRDFRRDIEASLEDTLYVTFVVPWAVVEELDNLKQSDRLGSKARAATTYLLQAFKNKRPGIRGQQMDEKFVIPHEEDDSFVENDNEILKCALFFSEQWLHIIADHEKERMYNDVVHTYLVTNDQNLCMKAMMHHVASFGSSDFPPTVEDLLQM